MQDRARGTAAVVASALIWGVAPLLYKQLDGISPVEVLAHRVFWSFIAFAALLGVQGRLATVRACLSTRRRVMVTALAAALVTYNWGMFVWAIQAGRAAEAALGYYVFPLMAAGLGVLVLKERLDRSRRFALWLAAAAVAILGLGIGQVPWVALTLGLTFACYGLVKKMFPGPAMAGVAAEVVLLAPLAAGYLVWTLYTNDVVVRTGMDWALLVLTGPVTVAPLILFSYGAQRIALSSAGLIAYLNPTLQFLIAVLVFLEPVTRWHAVGVPLIWVALAVFTVGAVRQDRSARRAATRSATPS